MEQQLLQSAAAAAAAASNATATIGAVSELDVPDKKTNMKNRSSVYHYSHVQLQQQSSEEQLQ